MSWLTPNVLLGYSCDNCCKTCIDKETRKKKKKKEADITFSIQQIQPCFRKLPPVPQGWKWQSPAAKYEVHIIRWEAENFPSAKLTRLWYHITYALPFLPTPPRATVKRNEKNKRKQKRLKRKPNARILLLLSMFHHMWNGK